MALCFFIFTFPSIRLPFNAWIGQEWSLLDFIITSCNLGKVLAWSESGHTVKVSFFTMGSLSPPMRCFTAPSFRETVLTVLLSLSATNRQFQGSSEAKERPEGWAKPALWGYALFRFSSFPLPANRRQVPFFSSLKDKFIGGVNEWEMCPTQLWNVCEGKNQWWQHCKKGWGGEG